MVSIRSVNNTMRASCTAICRTAAVTASTSSCATLPHSGSPIHSVEHVSQKYAPSNNRVHLFLFETVINIIIQGRNRNMRHVSRTHHVDLDWLFDIVNQDSTCSGRYVSTKEQMVTLSQWTDLIQLKDTKPTQSSDTSVRSNFKRLLPGSHDASPKSSQQCRRRSATWA